MTVYEALSLMIAFGALVAVICLSKKQQYFKIKRNRILAVRGFLLNYKF